MKIVRKNSISFITSLLLVVASLAGCSYRHQRTQDEIDAQVNQQISQTVKDMLAEPTSGKPLCMLLAYKDLASIGLDVAYKELLNGQSCYDQAIFFKKPLDDLYIYYVEPPTGAKLSFDSYTNYHVVGNHNIGDTPEYRTDTDTITIHNTPVIREYAPNVPNNDTTSSNTSELKSVNIKPAIHSQCAMFTRIPQGIILLRHGITTHQPTPKQETCQITEKVLTLLLDHAATGKQAPQYCLTINPTWLAAHYLATYPIRNYCQEQTYYYQPNPHAKPQTLKNTIHISIDNSDDLHKTTFQHPHKETLDHHTIYTIPANKTTITNYNNYYLLLPTKDHKTLYIVASSTETPLKKLEHTAKQITLYELEHNLPK